MAKHFIGQTSTENPGYMQAQIRVPAAEELHAGQVVVAETLDASLGSKNLGVYAPTKVADATKDSIALVLNNGFETMADGRRPNGQPDYTQYVYEAKATGVTAKNYLVIDAVKYFRLGGQSGMDMTKTLVVRAKMA